MRLSIERMVIENFKGTRKLTVDFGKEKTGIFGMNGTGKTTIPDAFSWVLFNKDSSGNAPGSDNFREKPLDDTGHEIHNLDTTVELACTLDGQRLDLKRTQRENWVKKRGSTNPEFKGNVSTYWINDVETKLADFKARIAEIAPEEVFRLIGTLAAFNAQDWKKRREQLIAMTGGEVDDRLLAMPKYRPIADECGQRNVGIDELKKILMDQRKRSGNEMGMIPVRIDEARKALPEFKKDEVDLAEYILKDNAKDIERIDEMIAATKATAHKASHEAEIAALESECTSIMRQVNVSWTDGYRTLQKAKQEAAEDLRRIQGQISGDQARNELLHKTEEGLEASIAEMRKKYEEVRDKPFEWPEEKNICPTCGQEMPGEKIAELKEAAATRYKQEKVEQLRAIGAAGVAKAKELEQLKKTIDELECEIISLNSSLEEITAREAEADKKMKEYPVAPDYDSKKEIAELHSKIAELKEQDSRNAPVDVSGYEARKAELKAQMDEKRAIIARRDAGLETEKRIAELEAQQKKVGAQLAELERMIDLVEKFVTDRCAALEESINEHFPTVRWKLFETQINGGIADVCNCMIPCESGLVAYSSANTAAQINADIEIVNVLSKHYDVYIPLFVDGAESVNRIAHTDSQLITLSVSTDSELTTREVE